MKNRRAENRSRCPSAGGSSPRNRFCRYGIWRFAVSQPELDIIRANLVACQKVGLRSSWSYSRIAPLFPTDRYAVLCSILHFRTIRSALLPVYHSDRQYFRGAGRWRNRTSSAHCATSDRNWRAWCGNSSSNWRSSAAIWRMLMRRCFFSIRTFGQATFGPGSNGNATPGSDLVNASG